MVLPNCDPNIPNSEEYLLFHDSKNFVKDYLDKNQPSHIVINSELWDKNEEVYKFLKNVRKFNEVKIKKKKN